MAKLGWADVRKIIVGHDRKALIGLVKELYSLNAENKHYLYTKFKLIDPLKHYKDIICQAVYPNYDKPIELSAGRKAISQYKKAVGDPLGEVELMVYYVECGNQCTLEFGDIDGPFYDSMISMFDKVVKALGTMDKAVIEKYVSRLHTVVKKSNGIGWGYYDEMVDIFYEAFPEEA